MARRFTMTALVLASLLLAGCSGGDGAEEAASPSSAGVKPQGGSERSAEPSRSPESTKAAGSPQPSETGNAEPSASSPPEPDGGDDGGAPGAPGAAAWSTARKSGEAHLPGPGSRPVLQEVRVGAHETYDRLVFEFSGGTPQFFAEYTDTLRQAGLGREIDVLGEHSLRLVFHGVTPESHFDGTDATSFIRECRTVSIFEGELRVGIGVDSTGEGRGGFRVNTYGGKVVLDIAHAAG